MKVGRLFSITSELPIRLKRSRLDPQRAKEFNEGYYDARKKEFVMFARTDYKYLYELFIDKGRGSTYIQLATPSFSQVLYSIWTLWNAYDGKPYDRHNHPVIMQAYDIEQVNPAKAKVLAEKGKKEYSKHKRKSTKKRK